MGNIPVLKPNEVIAILIKLGFTEVRQRGSVAVRLPPQQEAELLDALEEADREEGISAEELFTRLRRFG